MGGRVAEELTQDDITTGAGNDIERATELARRMVCEWGMSELGPLSFGSKDEPVFLGRDFAQRADYSEDTAIKIDQEVRRIVNRGYERAKETLTQHREILGRLAERLLELESLDGREVYALIQEMTGIDLAPPEAHKAAPPPPEESEPRPEATDRAPRGLGLNPGAADPLPSTD
jgi:cell division protease FtsH